MTTNDRLEQYTNFSAGVISPNSVSRDMTGKDSVQFAMNIDFDEVYGHAKVRKGSEQIGSDITGATDIFGISALRTFTNNIPVVAVRDGSNARMYYWDGSAWTASTGWTGKGLGRHRFASLNGRIFVVNGSNDMMSSNNGASWTTGNCPTSLVLSYVARYRGRLFGMTPEGLLYFSSIVSPGDTPFITWTPSTDRILINPDDGGYASGFALVGSALLVFKNNGFYRVDATNSAVTPDDLYHVGAISQESITVCKGMVYFYSGTSVYATDGTLDPQSISRPIQDILDSISNPTEVYMTSDENYVYVSVGDLVIRGIGYANVVLRYSIRSDSWTVYSYPVRLKHLFYNDKDQTIRGGSVNQIVEIEKESSKDGTSSIPFELILQEISGGSRAFPFTLQGKGIAVMTKDGLNTKITTFMYDGNQKKVFRERSLQQEVEIFDVDPKEKARYFHIMWSGMTGEKRPVFEGVELQHRINPVMNI